MQRMKRGTRLLFATVICCALGRELLTATGVRWGGLLYFTIQSNLLAALCLLAGMPGRKRGRRWALLQGMALIDLAVTGLVYNFVLYRIFQDWGSAGYTWPRIVTHVAAPLGFAVQWLVLEEHGMLQRRDVPLLLSHLALYGAASLGAGLAWGRSLYFFFNGGGGWLSLCVLAVGAAALTLLVVELDQRMKNKGAAP